MQSGKNIYEKLLSGLGLLPYCWGKGEELIHFTTLCSTGVKMLVAIQGPVGESSKR